MGYTESEILTISLWIEDEAQGEPHSQPLSHLLLPFQDKYLEEEVQMEEDPAFEVAEPVWR